MIHDWLAVGVGDMHQSNETMDEPGTFMPIIVLERDTIVPSVVFVRVILKNPMTF